MPGLGEFVKRFPKINFLLLCLTKDSQDGKVRAMNYFNMDPNNLDPRVRASNRARKTHRTLFGSFIALWLVVAVLNLAFWGAVVYVIAHFVTKFW